MPKNYMRINWNDGYRKGHRDGWNGGRVFERYRVRDMILQDIDSWTQWAAETGDREDRWCCLLRADHALHLWNIYAGVRGESLCT